MRQAAQVSQQQQEQMLQDHCRTGARHRSRAAQQDVLLQLLLSPTRRTFASVYPFRCDRSACCL